MRDRYFGDATNPPNASTPRIIVTPNSMNRRPFTPNSHKQTMAVIIIAIIPLRE